VTAKESLKNEVANLLKEGADIIAVLEKDFQKAHITFVPKYQTWYTAAIKILATLAPDRLPEFRSYYEIDSKRKSLDAGTYTIQDYTRGIGPGNDPLTNKPRWDAINVLRILIFAQHGILGSLSSRIDGVLANIEATLAADIEDTTLVTARRLAQINLRAAGTLAGVVLEGHLQRVARDRNIKTKSAPTIADLNEAFKAAGIVDIPTWRRIQLLADIRNLCTHKKDTDPTKEQIADLIAGVDWAIKTVT
jgi:hypothetical protein